MNLLVISHTAHYKKNDSFVGWGPTIREINYLAQIFDRVVHVAPLHSEPPPESALPYDTSKVTVRPVAPSGGSKWVHKLRIFTIWPEYIRTISEELSRADMVHVRCPANISLLAIIFLAIKKKPKMRWVKYAGNWQPNGRDPWSYKIQRWWLNRRFHRGIVTINGQWQDQKEHVHSFFNPCIEESELVRSSERTRDKQLSEPVRLSYVGRMDKAKGVDQTLKITGLLHGKGIPIYLDLIGDGPERKELEKMAASLGIAERVHFHGWLSHTSLASFYAKAHFMVFASRTEGWPKVLSEAMAFGVVPISSSVGSIPQYLNNFGTGRTFSASDSEGFTNAILWYLSNPHVWKKESESAMKAAAQFTYENYIRTLVKLLINTYQEIDVSLFDSGLSLGVLNSREGSTAYK